MREMGITSFKHDDLAIELGAEPARALAPRDPDAPRIPAKRGPTFDQLLFAATEGLPEDDQDDG